jgi:hypothetical protein
MAVSEEPSRAEGVGRLGTAAAWISAVGCLPYLVLKVVWTFDMPIGITDRSLLHSSGWVAGNLLMAVIQLAGLLLVLALSRSWARKVPAWLLLFPVWVGIGLLFQIVVGAVLLGMFPATSQASSGSRAFGGIQPWVFVMVYAAFAVQGAALAIAFACHVRARWGRLLGARTEEVLARRTARLGSRPEDRLAQMANAVAAMSVAVALVFGYWAAGGLFGLSGSQPHPSLGLQVSRMVGGVTAAVGLLGLAGRWGGTTRFWVPAALTWVGSGALAAFDGLNLALNRLFLLFGMNASQAGWSPIDTVLVIKVVIGVLGGAVGALALTAAATGARKPTRTSRTGMQTTLGVDRPRNAPAADPMHTNWGSASRAGEPR